MAGRQDCFMTKRSKRRSDKRGVIRHLRGIAVKKIKAWMPASAGMTGGVGMTADEPTAIIPRRRTPHSIPVG